MILKGDLMGLFDRFKKKGKSDFDYAVEFKNAFTNMQENPVITKWDVNSITTEIIVPWKEDYPKDPNVYYALVIIAGLTNNSPQEQKAIMDRAKNLKHSKDSSEYFNEWFENQANLACLVKTSY